MTSTNATRRDKPFLLTVTPVKYSLTEGTNIPPPPESPVKAAPPTTTSRRRPTTPERKIPGAFPSSDTEDEDDPAQEPTSMDRSSPDSAPNTSTSPQALRRQSGMRRMLSLSSLRQSFSSSRTSLALPRQSVDAPRPSTSRYEPSLISTTSGSPMQVGGKQQQPGRPRRSSWFKRKSTLFGSVDEDSVYDDRGNKRLKSAYSVPLLPDISELGGGDLDGGDLGWDATAFKRI